MNNSTQHAIESRVSINTYEPGRTLDSNTIESPIAQATRAPSAYNLQNWRFIALRSEDAKVRLKSAAFGQQKIVDASVAFIVCGTLAAQPRTIEGVAPAVQAGSREVGRRVVQPSGRSNP